MALRNPGGDSEAPPPPVAAPPPPVAAPHSEAPPPPVAAPPPHVDDPVPPQVPNNPRANVREWTTGLCGCFEDPSNCVITCFCPCVTFGQNAEIIDRGNISCAFAGALCYLMFHFFCCSYCYTCTYRTKLRKLYSIPGSQCGDCCLHHWCGPCALSQEYRELQNRGFDPSIGWLANMEQRAQQVEIEVPPIVPDNMVR